MMYKPVLIINFGIDISDELEKIFLSGIPYHYYPKPIKIKSQMKFLRRATYLLLIGEEEKANDTCQLRKIGTDLENRIMSLEEAIETMQLFY